jgi:hypothetical protein
MGLAKKIGIGFAVLVVLGIIGEFMPEPEDSSQPPAPVQANLPAAVVPASPTASPPPLAAHEPPTAHSVARAPAAPPPVAEPAPVHTSQQDGHQSCGQPATVAGTWQWAIGDGAPGILVITQQAQALVVAEFNALGQQIGVGAGTVCGRAVKIEINNALWGQFSISTRISGGNAMTGTVIYQGQQAAMQAMRQG